MSVPASDNLGHASLLRPECNDIKIEYHPNSARQPRAQHIEEYGAHESRRSQVPCDETPWKPFRSRLDFEAAELALQTAMTKEQTGTFFDLLHRAASSKEEFTLVNHAEVVKLWDLASHKRTGVCNF
jgi:hypothetical protein